MKKVLAVAAALAAALMLLCGCEVPTTTVYLDPGLKLENVDHAGGGRYITYRLMRPGEFAEEHVCQVEDRLGTLEGALIIIEQEDDPNAE